MIKTGHDYNSSNAYHEQNVHTDSNKQSSSFNKEMFKVLLKQALATSKEVPANELGTFGTNNTGQTKTVEDPVSSNKINWSLFEEGFPKKRCRKCSRIITDSNGDYCMSCARDFGGKTYGISD